MVDDKDFWPSKTDKAFCADGQRGTNVNFAWLQMFGLGDMVADGFKLAADMIVAKLDGRGRG